MKCDSPIYVCSHTDHWQCPSRLSVRGGHLVGDLDNLLGCAVVISCLPSLARMGVGVAFTSDEETTGEEASRLSQRLPEGSSVICVDCGVVEGRCDVEFDNVFGFRSNFLRECAWQVGLRAKVVRRHPQETDSCAFGRAGHKAATLVIPCQGKALGEHRPGGLRTSVRRIEQACLCLLYLCSALREGSTAVEE